MEAPPTLPRSTDLPGLLAKAQPETAPKQALSTRPGVREPADRHDLIVTVRALPSSVFGIRIVSTPSLKDAPTFSSGASCGHGP